MAQRNLGKQTQKRKQGQRKNCLTPIKTKDLPLKPIKLFGQDVIQQPIPKQHRQDIDIDIDELEVSGQGDNDYVDEDNFSIEDDNDTDYAYPESDESSDEDVQTMLNERKFVVFESKLYQLFITCKECGCLCEIEKTHTGRSVTIKTVCCNSHIFEYRSHSDLNNRPAGNVLIPSAIFFTGGSYEATKNFSQALNMNFVNKDQFYKSIRHITHNKML